MIKFSQNAQVVVLVTDMQASLLTPELVATALDAFHNRPALALLVRPPPCGETRQLSFVHSTNQPLARTWVLSWVGVGAAGDGCG